MSQSAAAAADEEKLETDEAANKSQTAAGANTNISTGAAATGEERFHHLSLLLDLDATGEHWHGGRPEDFLESPTGRPLLGAEPGGLLALIDDLHSLWRVLSRQYSTVHIRAYKSGVGGLKELLLLHQLFTRFGSQLFIVSSSGLLSLPPILSFHASPASHHLCRRLLQQFPRSGLSPSSCLG